MNSQTKTTQPGLSRPAANRLDALSQRLGPIEYRALSSLRNYARELRKHPEKQIVKLMASISEFGFVVPVLIDEEGTLIAGQGRAEAARRLNLAEVPTISITHLSSAQVKALRLAENRLAELSTWNQETLVLEIEEILAFDEFPIEMLGWETAEIDVMLGDARSESPDPADDIPEPTSTPVSAPGDLWLLGKHRLLCGSSLEESSWARLMGSETAAMSFVDPPYNVSVTKHVCGLGSVQHEEFAMASGEMSEAQFVEFLRTFLERTAACLKEGAIIHACMDWRHLFELLSAARAVDLSLLNLCVWNKSNGGMGSLYRSKHELVLVLKKGTAPHTNCIELGRHGRYRSNVWDFAGINSFGSNRMAGLESHPTVKPVALVAEAIRDVSRHGEIVVDAFVGSGTTILAAERTGRIGYGIEIEPKYVDVTVSRWEALTGKAAVLEGSGKTFSEVCAERADAFGPSDTQQRAA